MPLLNVGINYPWGGCGWDFGVPPWGTRKPWAGNITADLRLFRRLRIFCVRWFILADGFTYGNGPGIAPQPDPNPRNSGQWRFDPPRLTTDFLEDFTSLLEEFRRADIKILPSLISFEFCYPGNVKDDTGNPLPSGFIKCGRSDVITDPSKRNKFFDRVLEPLLLISRRRRFRDVVYAWEIINEPEWVTQGSGSKGKFDPTVPLAKMLEFIREGTKRINTSGFRSTVGYAKYESIPKWEKRCQKDFHKSLDITLHQFHYYADKERFLLFFRRRVKIPVHVFDPNWPCFVGEFASKEHEPWPELKSQDVYSRLKLLQQKKFPTGFIWSARASDSATDWSVPVQQMVGRYTSGR